MIPLNMSISKSNSFCNTRTWLSYASTDTVNVNYSCLEALSTACSRIMGCLWCSSGAGASQSSPTASKTPDFLWHEQVGFEFQEAIKDDP